MRLKQLELQGFKSFPDKTVIAFDRGITVVVGPNGSGKSNISDAMRWVLGENSSKSMRGEKMEDVVFAGSQKRSPMGFAEVSVTFDNSVECGKVASFSEYDEITVTRRYYRVGDSEYLINGKAVRLRDIHELFLNTGIGRDGYSIIGQGKIAEIISQKNGERRAIFEEAAGIARYRYQKTEAAKKLEDTDANLVRLEDIASVLGERVEPLEKESEKAKKYLEIREAKMAVDIALSLYDIDNMRERVDELARETASAKTDLENADETKQNLENAEERARNEELLAKIEREKLLARITELSGTIRDHESAVKLAENDTEHLRTSLISSGERIRVLEGTKRDAEAELARLVEKEKTEKAGVRALLGGAEGAENDVKRLETALSENESKSAALGAEIERLRREETDIVVRASVAAAQSESDLAKSAELSETIEKYEGDIRLMNGRIEKAEAKIAEYKKKEDTVKERLDESDAKKALLEKSARELGERKNNLFLDISQRRHKIQNLVRMEELLEGYSGAVRFILKDHKDGKVTLASGAPVKIYGPVSKLISVPDQYSAALEVAFGQSLQNIVVEDEESAKASIAYLKKKNGGRATFYPVSTMRGNEISANEVPEKVRAGLVSVASALIECDEKFRGIIRSLVGRILIATDMEAANKIARAMNFRYRIVTLDGQVINAGGSFTGGSLSPDGRMLSRRVQIEKLGDEVKALEAALADCEKEIRRASAEMAELKKNEASILSSASAMKTMHDAEQTQLTVLLSTRDAQKNTLRSLTEERALLLEKSEKAKNDIGDIDRRKQEFSAAVAEAEKARALLAEQKTQHTRALEMARTRHSEITVKCAAAEAGLAMITEMQKAAEKRLLDVEENIRELTAATAGAEEQIRLHAEEIVRLRAETERLSTELRESEAKKGDYALRAAELEKRLNELRIKSRDIMDRRDLLYRTYTKLESEFESRRGEQEKLLAFLWDEYELTYSDATKKCTEKVTKETRGEAVSAQNRYKNQLRSLGSVNVNAIEEYKSVKKQFDEMTAQITDLKVSKTDLLSIIESLEETMRRDFLDTVHEININFGKVFAELFGGGHAEISLSDPQNVLESGIDINVAPPGKVIKNMSLLSGGEQSFVAIALYFAIMKANPTPFCILDEIEAALDEVNVDKFADYVKHYSDKTQFVIITHRRGTMEAAERLYGVTMHEKGISDVISIDVSEIEQKIGVIQ